MGPHRPPDILRKSHAHSDGKSRARGKRELREDLDASMAGSADHRAVLIDLDGVVCRGDELIMGAAETVRWLKDEGIAHLLVTNTMSMSREALVAKLAGFGMEIAVNDIQAPPDAAAAWLAAEGCRRLLLAVPNGMAGAFTEFETQTLDEVIDHQQALGQGGASPVVDAVVIGDIGSDWNFAGSNAAFRCLKQDPAPRLIALGVTPYWNARDGLRFDVAPFVVALARASGVEPCILGKPAPAFFEAALRRLEVSADDTSMIGDDIRADVAGAQAAGLKGILVKTGKYQSGDLAIGIEPELVIDTIADLPRFWPKGASS